MGILDALFGQKPPQDLAKRGFQTTVDLLEEAEYKEGEDWVINEEGQITFLRGSARIIVDFTLLSERFCVTFLAPIVKLSADNFLPFYRRLLELNQNFCGLVSIGVEDDVVCVCTQRSLESMTELSLAEAISDTGVFADELDDLLHKEFGAPFYDPEDSE